MNRPWINNRLGFLSGSGELAGLMRKHDWSATSLGKPGDWPSTLKTVIGTILPVQAGMVLFWGPDNIALYNDAYAAAIGDKHPRALGSRSGENWSQLEPLLAKVRDTGEPAATKDMSCSPVREEDGRVGGVLCMVRQTLDAEADTRAAELLKAQAALQQSQKMEAIGNLAGGIAHDFNNSLMAVTGNLELLKKRIPGELALTGLIDNALEGAWRGSALTKRLLAFARRQDLKPETIDIIRLVTGMTGLMRRALGPSVTVVTDFPAGLPAVRSDASQLESALLNLAVNARDAMVHGGRIVISARQVQVADKIGSLAPGSYVCLCVTDSGEGMDEATLRHAAEPFFTTKGLGHGTGLGLSMVRGLVEQSGGALRLRSEKSKGTNAEIWLPLAQGAAATVQSDSKTQKPAPKESAELRVLAVDDDPLVLMNVVDMLEDLGHRVTSVNSGADALRQLQSDKVFDLLVTDHAMPKMTGAQLTTEVKRRWPSMKVMLATGYAELPPGTEVNVPRLSKPFTQDQLVEAITRLG